MTSEGTKRKCDNESSDSSTDVEIMEKTKKILETVTENLDKSVEIYREITSKISRMDKVSRKKATIGIFGKTGQGKSSLLTAVLGEKVLLPTSSFGACTSVVTQVEANLNDSNYTAEIELFSKENWDKELKDLFRVLSCKIEDRIEDLFVIAVEKITALYGAGADKKTLEQLRKDDKYAEIETFLSTNKKPKQISNSDVSEFARNIACYIQNNRLNPGGCYWPLVKSVTIKIPNCCELLEHIVFVDIPGTGDCNKQRDDLWKSKMRECSSVWIVSEINRAIDDRDPWMILNHCIEELGPGGECKSINFICTKTEEIDQSSYIQMAQLSNKISGDKDQKKECILHRNEFAKKSVKEKFDGSEIKKKFSTDKLILQVFTVSSKAFFDSSLSLEPSETEIPKLQDELRTLNKSINRECIRDYISEAKGVLSFIQSVQLDTDMKTVKMKDKIHKEFQERLEKALNELDKSFDSIYNDLEQCLVKGVKESVQSCVDTTKALIAPKKDGRGFHKILQAMCRNDGYYSSKNWDLVLDLNKDLAKHMQTFIDKDFILIFPVSGKTGKSVQEQINKFTIIQNDSAYPRSNILYHIQNFIKTEESNLKESLNRKVLDEKKCIYSLIQTTIQNEMASCYKVAAEETGDGSMKRRQDLLITKVDEIKQEMFNKAKMKVLLNFNHLKLDIKKTLGKRLNEIIEMTLKSSQITELYNKLDRLSEQLSDPDHQATKRLRN